MEFYHRTCTFVTLDDGLHFFGIAMVFSTMIMMDDNFRTLQNCKSHQYWHVLDPMSWLGTSYCICFIFLLSITEWSNHDKVKHQGLNRKESSHFIRIHF